MAYIETHVNESYNGYEHTEHFRFVNTDLFWSGTDFSAK